MLSSCEQRAEEGNKDKEVIIPISLAREMKSTDKEENDRQWGMFWNLKATFPNAGSKPIPNNLSGSVVLSPGCALESPGELLEHSCAALCRAPELRVSGKGLGAGEGAF